VSASSAAASSTSAKKKKVTSRKLLAQKLAQTTARQVEETEKIPFSEVGTESSVTVPPPVIKPVTPVVKVRNRTPLPMPEDTPSVSVDNESTNEAE
jgi:hypothetical protein